MAFDFDRETALTPTGDGLFHAELDPVWSVVRGPNGGYIAALILNAMRTIVGDDGRHPRSLTIHYIAPAATEPLEIAATVERTGRSMTAVSARAIQGDNVIAVALGAFSTDRPGPELDDAVMPAVMAVGDVPVRDVHVEAPPIAHRWESRQVLGRSAFQDVPPSERAEVAAWMRLPEGHLPDAAVVAAATDGFIPAVFSRVDEPMVVPTVDLTIHFRRPLPYDGASPDDFLLGYFTTKVITGGFLEEDGEIWSPDGLLLAQSRQLAVAFPFTPPAG